MSCLRERACFLKWEKIEVLNNQAVLFGLLFLRKLLFSMSTFHACAVFLKPDLQSDSVFFNNDEKGGNLLHDDTVN